MNEGAATLDVDKVTSIRKFGNIHFRGISRRWKMDEISKMKLFEEIANGFHVLTIFVKSSVLCA